MRPILFSLMLMLPWRVPVSGVHRHDVDVRHHVELAADPAFASVGRVVAEDGSTAGSFVLVAPGWVLTAAHVVADRALGSFRLEVGGERRTAVEVIIHPDYQAPALAEHAEAVFRKGLDAALLRLDRPVRGTRPATLYRGDREVGSEVTLVGYGAAGDAMTAITSPDRNGLKRAGQNRVDAVGGVVDGRPIPDWYIVTDFDHPHHGRLNRTGSATPLPLEFMVVGGDSGGGLFLQDSGHWVVAGIPATARISVNDSIERDGLYGSLNMAVRVSAIEDWITAHTRAVQTGL